MTNMTEPTEFPSRESPIFLKGPVGRLEAMETPGKSPLKPITAVICHPHPLFGGTMHNKVVHTLARMFRDRGIATIRFNFRGVGTSEGHYDEGVGEVEDALAVLKWAKKVLPNNAIWLAGFSFGSYIVLKATESFSINCLITVAPAVTHFPVASIKRPPIPWIIVQGDQDEVVEPEAVFSWIETLHPPPELIRMQGATHFFHGRLVELREKLEAALQKYL